MKTESIALVQTALLGVIATLLLILIGSSLMVPAASANYKADPMQELAVLCQIAHHMEAESDDNATKRRAIENTLNGKQPDEFDQRMLKHYAARDEKLHPRIDALNQLIEEKSRAIPHSQKK